MANYTGPAKFVLIVTDSRGSWLHKELKKYQLPRLRFTVIYRRGAGLKVLWETIEDCILTHSWDYVLILGGVCDITDRYHVLGRREFWPPHDMDSRFAEIYTTMRDIVSNFKIISKNTQCKMAFLPEPGLDLVKYNQVPHPVPWRILVIQAELESRMELLQLYTRVLNSHLGSLTPWTMDITHAHRNGRLVPVYDRMNDGVHFSGNQIRKLAEVLANFSRNELIVKSSLWASTINT